MNPRPPRLLVLAALAIAALTLGTGCSNKTAAERDSLAKQNRDLQSQLDEERAARAAAESRANAVTESATAAPTTQAAAPSMEETTGGVATAEPGTIGTGITTGVNAHGENTITVSSDILFDTGKAALKPAAKKALDKVAVILKKEYPGRELRIEGYTDPRPVRTSGWDDNWDLGAARARSVLLYLQSKGIHNMYIASFGDTKAVGMGGTTSTKKGKKSTPSTGGYAADRKVEIVVVKNGM
ncbi:MAG TPA: OmpA family protein [Phycisphaerae bacterium]|nr:OmpA family protein [Phycisphaerae bacterium]